MTYNLSYDVQWSDDSELRACGGAVIKGAVNLVGTSVAIVPIDQYRIGHGYNFRMDVDGKTYYWRNVRADRVYEDHATFALRGQDATLGYD
jgi:hypothetical protein